MKKNREELERAFLELKNMDYNLNLIVTYSIVKNKKDDIPDFDTQKLKRLMPGFDTRKIPLGYMGLQKKNKPTREKGTGFAPDMYDNIE